MATHQLQKNLHFLMIPFPSQSRLIPMIDVARLLAQRNAMLPFPHAEAGLPEGYESINTLPSPTLFSKFTIANQWKKYFKT
ncbi:hypothetical protein TorRG33x02_025960 [Trema orientale]|uniref:UDP-glucuronosyl/UDP-glucosyltransferase n=1 Tax=Trema orientale TaxID=63057 RepID=A0A2P5FVK8_TREOI|nr:hypothetical protein TorRG33x02_025960 [Trema orientale]